MTVLNVDGKLYGEDNMGQRWSIPVANVAALWEEQGGGVMLWVAGTPTYVSAGMSDDTLESVHEAVFGSAWPSDAPQQH